MVNAAAPSTGEAPAGHDGAPRAPVEERQKGHEEIEASGLLVELLILYYFAFLAGVR
jgi:hypothetical protein